MTDASGAKPHVLLIVADQLRWDALGCYGNEVVETPNIDWLAAQGTVLDRAYSPVPACIPARASLTLGKEPWDAGIIGTGAGNPRCANLDGSLPETLAAAGYHTQGVGKMHFSPQRSLQGFHHTVLDEEGRAQDPGFVSDYRAWFMQQSGGQFGPYDHGVDQNSWVARPWHAPEYMHATNWTAAEGIAFLERRDPERPFFLKLSFSRPHSPYDPPQVYFDRYLGSRLTEPVTGDWSRRGRWATGETTDPNAWSGTLSADDAHRARAGYFGAVNHVDHQIGLVLRHLRDSKLDDDTLVVLVSDHGDMLGDHGLWRKTRPFEGAVHIPTIVRLPRRMRGAVVDRVPTPVCLADVMPTILDVAGVPSPKGVTGLSMMPAIRGERTGLRDVVHGEYTRHPVTDAMHFITDGLTKYVWFPDHDEELLFDLEADPYETTDLAGDAASQDRLQAWRHRLSDVLADRDSGMTRDGRLVPQAGLPIVLSPNADERRIPAAAPRQEQQR